MSEVSKLHPRTPLSRGRYGAPRPRRASCSAFQVGVSAYQFECQVPMISTVRVRQLLFDLRPATVRCFSPHLDKTGSRLRLSPLSSFYSSSNEQYSRMAFLCSCFGSRSRIYLPSDDQDSSPSPRLTRIIEPKIPSSRSSIVSHRRQTRPTGSPRNSSLHSEKDALLVRENEVEEDEDDNEEDTASQSSSSVSIPSSRITSLASTFTGSTRVSYADSELPPYTAPPRREYPGFTTAGDLFRDIQRQIAASQDQAVDIGSIRPEKK